MFKIIKGMAFIIVLALVHFYFYSSEYVKKIDYEVYDLMMMLTNEIKRDDGFYTVVVEIDEQSLQTLGQWPWPRVISANLIEKIHELNPSALGVSILFPEVDRISPINIQTFYRDFFNLEVKFQNIPLGLKDNDNLLLNSVANSRTTLSTHFSENSYSSKHCEDVVYKDNIFSKRETKLNANSFLCNHKKLQNGIENFGFITAGSDSDGVFRRVPLFIKYQEKVFPSFSLATLLSVDKNINLNSQEDTMLLNFPLQKPKVFSAIDILNGKIPKDEIQGKIVILGLSVVGLTQTYRISTGETISNSMIHAFAIDNILNENFLRQAPKYKIINLCISFILILWFIFLFSQKSYLQIILFLSLITFISILGTLYLYLEGIYISTAYLWFPFLFLFILLIIYHIRAISKERVEQEKLFIRQSKLASMGEMISLIAHQWRQPLSAINGTVLNLDMDYHRKKLDDKTFNKYLDDIELTTEYLSKTINDFTDFFSKNKQTHFFSLSTVIRQAQDLSLNTSTCNVEVIYENSKDIEIKGYASELVQSLLVLLNNAIYICQKNVKETEEGKIFIRVSTIEKDILISVEDNGGGVAKKDMKKVFNPYFTTKEQHNGTGLGLYILKLIVEDSMNGKVFLYNTQEGAVFTIQIPMNIE